MAKNKQVMRVKGGSAVQQDRLVQFTFDGKSYMGCAGDTLASALLANNVHLVGRSFKYHHPRGIMAAGACLLYTSPSPRDRTRSRMPSSA